DGPVVDAKHVEIRDRGIGHRPPRPPIFGPGSLHHCDLGTMGVELLYEGPERPHEGAAMLGAGIPFDLRKQLRQTLPTKVILLPLGDCSQQRAYVTVERAGWTLKRDDIDDGIAREFLARQCRSFLWSTQRESRVGCQDPPLPEGPSSRRSFPRSPAWPYFRILTIKTSLLSLLTPP